MSLPPMKRVIGGSKIILTGDDAAGTLNVTLRYLCGATDLIGFGKLVGKQY